MHFFSNLFWYRTLHISDRFTVHHQGSSTVYTAMGSCRKGHADCLLARSGWIHPGAVRKILPPTGTRSPDRPTQSESLYRLSYAGRFHVPLCNSYLTVRRLSHAEYVSQVHRLSVRQRRRPEGAKEQITARSVITLNDVVLVCQNNYSLSSTHASR